MAARVTVHTAQTQLVAAGAAVMSPMAPVSPGFTSTYAAHGTPGGSARPGAAVSAGAGAGGGGGNGGGLSSSGSFSIPSHLGVAGGGSDMQSFRGPGGLLPSPIRQDKPTKRQGVPHLADSHIDSAYSIYQMRDTQSSQTVYLAPTEFQKLRKSGQHGYFEATIDDANHPFIGIAKLRRVLRSTISLKARAAHAADPGEPPLQCVHSVSVYSPATRVTVDQATGCFGEPWTRATPSSLKTLVA